MRHVFDTDGREGFMMSSRFLRSALVALTLSLLGAQCPPAPTGITITQPTAGGDVTTLSFAIQIQLAPATFDLGTLEVRLNGQVLGNVVGGPENFTATVDPGPPLSDLGNSNFLQVVAQRLGDGKYVVAQRVFNYVPPKAVARRITDAGADCITGPLAHCRANDWLLENDVARFVVQDAPQRDFNQIGAYGGNLIDAEIVEGGVRKGNDNFWELQPAANVETVFNAQSVEILNRGYNGLPARVRTCGPDDLLDGINPSSVVADFGASLPPGVDDQDYDIIGCTVYSLVGGKRYVEVVTTIENLTDSPLPLYPGDYVSGAGELEQLTPLSNNALVKLPQAGVGEMLANWGVDALSYFGFDEATGVDYALLAPTLPEVSVVSSSFTTTGVSYVLHGQSVVLVLIGGASNFSVPAFGTKSLRRWFSVGDGSAANALEYLTDIRGTANGTLNVCVEDSLGNPVPHARVIAARDPNGGTTNANVVRGHWITGANGCSSGQMPAGAYRVAGAQEGYPYQGGGSTPATTVVTVPSGGSVNHTVVLPQAGRLHVEVVDENDDPTPARLTVVGYDPSPERVLTSSVVSANDTVTNFAFDQTKDKIPGGLTRTEYIGPSGVREIDLEPGSYQVVVSRGTEYSAFKTGVVAITGGVTTAVNAKIGHVIDTPGFISSDYHTHMIDSPDSRISMANRCLSMAGEGLDNIVATDHSVITNLSPKIAEIGLTPFLHATPGEEVTTFDTGHYNSYPQGLNPSRAQTRGSTDWAAPAPPGEDFPSFGNYILSPAQIDALVQADPDNAGLGTITQINHIDSHFLPLRIDTSQEPPHANLDPGDFSGPGGSPGPSNPLFFRLDPSIPEFYHHFPALELWNGSTTGAQHEFLDLRIGIWMNQLNQGLISTAIADTDTHTLHDLNSGGGRTWTPSSTDAPAGILDSEIASAVAAGKAVGGQGIYVQAALSAASTGETADFGLGSATLVKTTDGSVDLDIDVQAPVWAPYDRIEIYMNASTCVSQSVDGTPVLFGAVPTQVLTSGGGDFTVNTVNVLPAVPAGDRLETQKTVTLSGLTGDAWVAVLVKGTQGTSPSMFPIFPSGLSTAANPTLADLMNVTASEAGIRALGFTNALFIDVDGNGQFDPPGVSVAGPCL
jgi:hypothetical protein